MELSKQVTSLELSKKLKGLGVKQESLFSWIYTEAPLTDGTRDRVVPTNTLSDSHWELGGEQDTYSAFTVAELLSLIGEPRIAPAEGSADMLAEELTYLLENNLITLPNQQ